MQWLQNTINLEIDISSYCNARCPSCVRTNQLENVKLEHFDFDIWRRLWFDDLKNTTIQVLELNGNWGDPLMHPEILPMLDVAKYHNPELQLIINTNGGIRNTGFWKELGEFLNKNYTKHRVNFGIDGTTQDTHGVYRVDVELDKVLENTQAFNLAGGNSYWTLTVFDHNVHQIKDAVELAKELGFRSIQCRRSYTRNIENIATTDCYDTVPHNEIFFFEHFKNTPVPKYSDGIQHPCRYYAKQSIQIDPYHNIWPCCYVSGKLYEDDGVDILQDSWNKYGYKCNSLEKFTFEEILNSKYFTNEIQSAIDTARWQPCVKTCGIK